MVCKFDPHLILLLTHNLNVFWARSLAYVPKLLAFTLFSAYCACVLNRIVSLVAVDVVQPVSSPAQSGIDQTSLHDCEVDIH